MQLGMGNSNRKGEGHSLLDAGDGSDACPLVVEIGDEMRARSDLFYQHSLRLPLARVRLATADLRLPAQSGRVG